MNGWVDKLMNKSNGWMDGRTDGLVEELMDGYMNLNHLMDG
jgi:hypothetical protein